MNQIDTAERTLAKGKWFTPDITVKLILCGLLFGGLLIFTAFFSVINYDRKLEIYQNVIGGIVLLITPAMSFLIWLNSTYSISCDDDAIYMTGVKWQWRKLRFVRCENTMFYDEIAEIGVGHTDGIMPFCYIPFRREGGEWEERFFMSRVQLYDPDSRPILLRMYAQIPEKFPPEIVDFMNGLTGYYKDEVTGRYTKTHPDHGLYS